MHPLAKDSGDTSDSMIANWLQLWYDKTKTEGMIL